MNNDEFKNDEPGKILRQWDDRGEIVAPYQPVMDELQSVRRRVKYLDYRATLLVQRLHSIKYNYADDMRIIDTDSAVFDGEIFPWKAPSTKRKYEYWDITPKYLHPDLPHTLEVAIRKEGNERIIPAIKDTCRRIEQLDDMSKTLWAKEQDLIKDLSDNYQIRVTDK